MRTFLPNITAVASVHVCIRVIRFKVYEKEIAKVRSSGFFRNA